MKRPVVDLTLNHPAMSAPGLACGRSHFLVTHVVASVVGRGGYSFGPVACLLS